MKNGEWDKWGVSEKYLSRDERYIIFILLEQIDTDLTYFYVQFDVILNQNISISFDK